MDYKAKRNKRAQINNAASDKSPQAAGQNNYQHNGFKKDMNISPKQNAVNHSAGTTFQTGECIACRKTSICVCERCGDYYCSPDCQKKDWQSHRYICFPMPKLVQPSSVLSTDAVYPVNAPLLTVNQISNANNIQRTQQQPQNSRNNSQQSHSLMGHPPYSDTDGQQQQANIRAPQKANNKDAKQAIKHTTTATVPTVDLPKPNSHVTLTGFRTPNRCYVRAVNPSVDDDSMLNARKIDVYGKVAKPLDAMPKLHSYAIAPYNGVMHRVEVLFVRNPANIRVLFIDRGVIATRNLRDLREISDEIISLKQYTCLIQMRNVSNYVLSEKLTKHFARYEDQDFKIKYDRVENGVELLHWQNEKSLNDEVEQFCKESGAEVWSDAVRSRQNTANKNTNANVNNAKQQNSAGDSQNVDEPHDDQFYALEPGSSAGNSHVSVQQKQSIQEDRNGIKEEKKNESVVEVEHPTMRAPFEINYFKVNCAPFKAVVLDVSCLEIGYLGCIAQHDLECLQIVHKQLESITVSDKPYKPQLEEYCIAKFEGMWYRAQVIDIPNESEYTVMYIDFTNEATLTSADIRHFPASVTGACKTSLCLIDGLPTDLSAELIRFLNEEIQLQTVITIDRVKNIDEQVVVVECKSLLDKIRQNNLLT